MIDISFDEKRVARVQRLAVVMPKETARGMAYAINRTIARIKKEAAKDVRTRYVVKAKAVKGNISSTKATVANLTGMAEAKGNPVPLGAFFTKRYKKGPMKAKVLKASSPKPVPGLFARDFPSGYTGPMLRFTRSSYPLKTPAGPSVPQMMGNAKVIPIIAKDAEEYMNKELDHELDHRISKLLGG